MEQRYLTELLRDKAFSDYKKRGYRVKKVGLFSLEVKPSSKPIPKHAKYSQSAVWDMGGSKQG